MNISDVLEASAIQGAENFSSDAAKLYRFSTTNTMPAYPEIFQVVCVLQRASTELTIFSHELGEIVTIAYPHGSAFCGLLTEHCTPVRFDTNHHGHAMAYCHQSPSECGFSLNISKARETALYESVYTDVLTRVYLNHPRLVNLRDLVLRVHRDRLTAMPSEHAQLFPYFEGYCGTPISGLAPSQRGGAVRNIASYHCRPISALNMRQQRITHYIRRQPVPPVDELASLSLTEQNALRSLADGKGITEYEHIGLLELCGGCQKMFTASALRSGLPYMSNTGDWSPGVLYNLLLARTLFSEAFGS
ncbi:hypothetical protein DFJ58DRAFT_835030 [Suillus subalutaceus]|uniref:uncharacterized protein n=1 Tax=Suillus subalutaceus TaxID=48586 RepID=UPI001B86AC52|nr:uncharacterized protein DFJ58DRAFT_835030 [Suillus subalutaceus]KAG1813427.1 hypothetical protein DFJ58DRAFT_835030 [Suillus subalutaceus]